MRDICNDAATNNLNSDSVSSDDEANDDISMDVWMGTDPFYDRFPWFRLVGRLVFIIINFKIVFLH